MRVLISLPIHEVVEWDKKETRGRKGDKVSFTGCLCPIPFPVLTNLEIEKFVPFLLLLSKCECSNLVDVC